MVMEEEKYNVNILAADSVDSSGEPNFPQKGFQSFLHRMEIRPLLCLLCQSEGKNKTMPSFLFSPQGRWRIQGKDRKLQLLLNVLEWEVHPGTFWRPTGPNSTRLIEPNIHRSLLNSSKWIRNWGTRHQGHLVRSLAPTWRQLASISNVFL